MRDAVIYTHITEPMGLGENSTHNMSDIKAAHYAMVVISTEILMTPNIDVEALRKAAPDLLKAPKTSKDSFWNHVEYANKPKDALQAMQRECFFLNALHDIGYS